MSPTEGSGGWMLALLRPFLPSDWREDIVRDLEEQGARCRARRGRVRASIWLFGQIVVFAGRFGPERVREAAVRVAGDVRQDLAHAVRSARAAPVFLVAVVLTLAVGIGANTVVFSVVKTVLLEPLPYPASERLVVGGPYPWTPAPIVRDAFDEGPYEATAGYYPQGYVLTGTEAPVELEGVHATPGFFELFGGPIARGRAFVEEDARGAARVAILSDGAWRTHFGGAPDILGRTIRLNGRAHEIVGVLERGFRQLTPRVEDPDVWVAGRLDALGPEEVPEESGRWAIPLARIAPSVASDLALARADAGLREARERFRGGLSDEGEGPSYALRWAPLKDEVVQDAGSVLAILQATVALLLLLASVNVANLLLARFGARRAEVAIRNALGASRGRLVRQLTTESVGLAAGGGAVGIGLALLTRELVIGAVPTDIPRLAEVTIDGGVLLFGLALTLGTGALFGLIPALTATAVTPGSTLRKAGRGAGGGRRRHRMSRALAMLQVTLTMLLLVGAGLNLRSLALLTSRDPGFRTDDVLLLRIDVPDARHASVAELDGFYSRTVDRLARVPGVEAAALSNRPPVARAGSSREYRLAEAAEPRVAHYGVVSAGYFDVLDLPLLRGRYLDDSDGPGSVPVGVVDRAFWNEAWPGEDPVGERFLHGDEWRTVVGVVERVRGAGLASEPEAGFYIPHRQRPDDPVELAVARTASLLLHVPGLADDTSPVTASTLRRAIQDVAPRQPVAEVVPLEALLAEESGPQRFRAVAFGAFATVGLLLSLSGVYGVIGQLLVERRREFGILRALGATGRSVAARVVGWGMALTLPGVALGLLGVLLVGPRLEGLLFGVRSTDPLTLGAVTILVVLLALAACAGPAWRAMRVDPGITLRED